MTDLRTAAQQVLEALDDARHHMSAMGAFTEIQLSAQDALRAALAEPPIGKASTDVGVPVYVVKKAEPPCNPSCAPGYCYCEPVEPVAWRFEARHIDSAWGAAVSLKHPGPEGVYMRNVVPLYTSPPQRPAEHDTDCHAQGICQRSGYGIGQRKPLTEEEILLISVACAASHQQDDVHFARAVEAAHGIKEGT